MHCWQKVITVLIVMWLLTTAQVINVECGVIYVDKMVVGWRIHQLQWCVIHAMLLAISLNAWRLTRPNEEDSRTPPCVTLCYSVLTVELHNYKKGAGVEQTPVVNVTVSIASLHTILKRTGSCASCDLFMQASLNKRHHVILFFMI